MDKGTLEQLPSSKFIGGKSGGVPESIFSKGVYGLVKGASGKTTLRYEFDATDDKEAYSVKIVDYDNPDLGIKAGVMMRNLSFSVFTRGYQGNPDRRHPDFYAKKLALRMYNYFVDQGVEINALKGTWIEGQGDTNLEAFDRNLLEYEPMIEQGLISREEALKKSALNTWTGQLAQELGFSEVDTVKTYRIKGKEAKRVVFRKPEN